MRINQILVSAMTVTLLLSGCKKETNPNPVGNGPGTLTAEAGGNQVAPIRSTITLDGSGSKDTQNKPFTYQWLLIRKPTASVATRASANTAKPTFVPDKTGEYEVELTIANAEHSSKDRVVVVATPLESTLLSEQINAKTVLEDRSEDPVLPDYIVNKRLIVNAELTIKPGVTIAFARDAQFTVNADGGILIAKGEANRKIRFVGKEATKGFWQGLWVTSTSSGNVLEQVEILHGGGQEVRSAKAGLTLSNQAQLSLKNSLVSQSGGYGLHAMDGTALREFASNTFSNNTESGVYVSADNVKQLDAASVFTAGNGRNVVNILKSDLSNTTNETVWKRLAGNTPYRIAHDLTIQTGLRLEPGVVLQAGPNVAVRVESKGYLNAVGTATNRIRIEGAEAGSGYWRGLIFSYSSSAKNVLEYVDISGGGSSPLISGQKANLALSGSTLVFSIRNSTLSRSAGYGIMVTYDARNRLNTDAATANTFEGNTQGAILIEK
jgi:hypothetical protein